MKEWRTKKLLEVRDIQKFYENQLLLDGISFKISADETICLLGPSGGGKSTLLRIIAGLEDAEGGQVLWNGEGINDLPAHKRNFGLMFQDYALFPHMDVYENIAFGLRMQRLDAEKIQKRVEEALDLVDMRSFLKRRVTDLSGGEQQRIALARALVARPRLLMLDEPLGALDRALREQLSQNLRDVLDRMDIPVIYVTHDQEEAFAFADRLLVLHEGSIIQAGSPAEVYNHPQSLWLANFFGHSNQLEGIVVETNPVKVKTSVGLIECDFDDDLSRGQSVKLVMPSGAARLDPEGENYQQAVVKQVHFQGRDFMIDFQLVDGQVFTFYLDQQLKKDQQISLYIQPSSIICFP